MDLGEDVHVICGRFPEKEVFNLTSQMRRAMDSVALNIAEGSIGQSIAEQKRFVSYAIRSLAEVVTCLHKAIRRGYIDNGVFNEKYLEAFHLMNMLIGFRNNVR